MKRKKFIQFLFILIAGLVINVAAGVPVKAQGSDPLGQRCLPGEQPPRAGLSCQVTDAWTMTAPQIVNAKKGDIVLTAGCSTIGNLLKEVSPPQFYSHTGIMTRDRVELRHSTAAAERYGDHAGTDGIDPNRLKYGWPGTLTQSVSEAYEGQYLRDPDNKVYRIGAFNPDPVRCGKDLALVSPVLIKPPPRSDAQVRAKLHAAADAALNIRGHYRFYGYTNGSIALNPAFRAPAEAGWAAGTEATVCSVFIAAAHKRAGNTLEGDLEPEDVLRGARPGNQPAQDGLYFYTEAERRGAAEWLHSHLHNQVYQKAGWLGEFLTDASDDLANQVTNCFASDWCSRSAKDSEAWRRPGPGYSVSPDDMFFWDAPPQGVYGYAEPLIYRTQRYERVYRWQPSAGTGTIIAQVHAAGQPVEDARVTVAGLEKVTRFDGRSEFRGVPAGRYEIKANKIIDGFFYTDQRIVQVEAGQTQGVRLDLQPPPNIFRLVIIQGQMFLLDDENFPDSDEKKTVPFHRTVRLDPWNRRGTITLRECVGGEVRAEVDVQLQLQSDNTSVATVIAARLYEGTSCSSNDLEDQDGFSVIIPEDGSSSGGFRLRNSGFGGGDKADIDFTITNARQP